MNADEFETLGSYLEKVETEKINISFNGCDWYRYKVKNLKTYRKYERMREYLVVGIAKRYITIMSRKKVEKAIV